MGLLEDLLGRGYFPRELPPTFVTAGLAAKVIARGSPIPRNDKRWTRPVTYNLARPAFFPRVLSIPNPLSHIALCAAMARRFPWLQVHTLGSAFSRSTPVLGSRIGRAVIPQYDWTDLVGFRLGLRTQGRFIVKADVASCYGSIYTHSVPWALMGKAIAKSNQSPLRWEYQIDAAVRNERNGQTNGIPVGPDTSLILAEIVLSAVDRDLAAAFPGLNGIRYIDDYEFVCTSRAEAERVHAGLQRALGEFELSLNPAKSSIAQLPEPVGDEWASNLRRWWFATDVASQGRDLIDYFDAAFRASEANRAKRS